MLATSLGGTSVALTDSGTSALVLALRLAARADRSVALPAYGCVDLLAAAAYAQLRVRLYDVDPATLSPDLESVRRALARGAETIVVAHFYGYPADVPGVTALAADAGAVVIEDAAQRAGGGLAGAPLGALGPLVVLSFGRGKGTTGGNGGALLARTPEWSGAVAEWQARITGAPPGWGDWAAAAAQWAAGRPALYGIPASMPGLHLGETIYTSAHEPERLSLAAASLVERALRGVESDRQRRAQTADALRIALADAHALRVIQPIPSGESGFLRLPVLDTAGRRAAPRLGIVRSYPRPLGEEPVAATLLAPNEPANPGAGVICETLFTLPTHAYVTETDRERILAWSRPGKADTGSVLDDRGSTSRSAAQL